MKAKYKQGKLEINIYELPIVPIMVHPHETEDWRFVEHYLSTLEAMNSQTATWAIQTIAELQALWIEAADKLRKIEEISRND